jgi:hypothetical protein
VGFDFYFYLNYLRSLPEPEPPERRLFELHPSLESIRLAFEELCAHGLLIRDDQCRAPRLSEEVLRHEGAVNDFCAALAEPSRRAWLAGVVGDWPATRVLLGSTADSPLAALAGERSAALRRDRIAQLVTGFDQGGDQRVVLYALADLGADELPRFLIRTLYGEPSGAMSAALDILAVRPDAGDWCPEVHLLYQRLDPSGPAPHPYLWASCARFLFRHDYKVEQVGAALPRAGGYMVGEAAVMAFEYAPAHAVELFRRALRSDVPANRCTAAAALALIDRPWSRAELLAVLRESDDQERTSECRAALAESRDPGTREAVQNWEERNPHEAEIGPFISMREMLLRHQPQWLRYQMDELRERLVAVTRREVPEG